MPVAAQRTTDKDGEDATRTRGGTGFRHRRDDPFAQESPYEFHSHPCRQISAPQLLVLKSTWDLLRSGDDVFPKQSPALSLHTRSRATWICTRGRQTWSAE